MSISSSSASTPRKRKPSILSWRNQALSKNSSPARLTYVVAEPEHSTQESKASVDDDNQNQPLVSTLRRPHIKSLKGPVGVPRPGSAASECGIPRARPATEKLPSPSRRTTRAARPALVSMIVRAPEQRPVTLLESPVSVNGLLNIPTSAKGKQKDASSLGQEVPPNEKPLEVLNTDPFPSAASGSNTTLDDIPPPPSNCIPSTTPSSASAGHVPSNDSTAKHDSTSSTACSNSPPLPISSIPSNPSIDADPSGPTALSDQPKQPTQSDNPSNTLAEAPLPKAPAESSASSKKEGSSWFTTSWLSWSSPAPNNSISNTHSSRVKDDGYLTDEHRANSTGNTRDGGDIDRQSPRQDNINCPDNVRERPREDDVKASQASQCRVADDGADKASMSIPHGDRNGKTSTHGNPLPGSARVEKQNPTPTTMPIQTSSHVDKLKSPSTDPESAVDMSLMTTATPTPPDATAVSAPSASASDLVPSASGLTDASPSTTAQASSSWWDYIGWTSAAAPTGVPHPSTSLAPTASTSIAIPVASPSARDTTLDLDRSSSVQGVKSEDAGKDIPSQGTSPPSNVTGSESKIPKSVSAPVPSDEGAPQGDGDREQAHAQQQQPEQAQAQVQEPREPHHHGHTRNAAASSWYNPWSWYESSSHPPVADTHGADEAHANEESEKSETVEEHPMEPSGGTQESQAPQPQAPQVSVSPPEEEQAQPPTAATVATSNDTVVEHNPISATIDSHRSGWLSFFASTSSRALITKTITAPQAPDSASVEGDIPSSNNVKVDENGMEVMDIDDEADSPASQVSQAQLPSSDSSNTKEGAKDKESKALSTVSSLSTAQGLVATLVRGRGRVRSIQGRVDADKESLKDGLNSDASSVRSGVGGQGSGTATPVNGTPIPSKPGSAESPATGAGSLSSSPASTTVSLVKRASLSLTGVGTKTSTATTTNGNTTTTNSTSTSITTAASTTVTTATAAAANDKNNKTKSVSPAPSPTSKKPVPPPPLPNLVLPSWQDTFHTLPRSIVPRRAEAGTLTKTVQYVSGWLFSGGRSGGSSLIGGGSGRRGREAEKTADKGKRKASSVERKREQEREFMHFGMALPKAWDILDSASQAEATNLKADVLRGSRRVVVIGVHGWFPGAVMRTVIGEPTGTSTKLANMMAQALKEFENEHGTQFEKVTKIPLEGEGTVKHRVEKLYSNLLGNKEWMDDLRTADAILMATHSQGSVVSTHLLDRLIADKHIRTAQNSVVAGPASSFPAAAGMETAPAPKVQRVCCLAMCGIHLGPLRYLSTSSLFQPYIQYLESAAARELFEFQNTNSEASKEYVKALRSVLSNGVKMVYAASLNDQVVPIYSGLFTAASHPLILRALYIDGDAYNSSDFLANLLVLLLRILNSGIPDSGLLVHLSEATAGSLNGVGHSSPYEEIAIFSLAVKYLFLTNDGLDHPELILDPFNARQEQNDYEIPWALRDAIADERVARYFSKEIVQLRDAFREWHPRTSILRDLKRKLQPIQRLPASFATSRL